MVGLLGVRIWTPLAKNAWYVNSPRPGRPGIAPSKHRRFGPLLFGTFSWPEIRGVSFLVEWLVVPIRFHWIFKKEELGWFYKTFHMHVKDMNQIENSQVFLE